MTLFTAKQTLRGPLVDKTNVLNMKSSKTGDNVEVTKRANVPTISLETPVQKLGRIRRKNVLFDTDVYKIDYPRVYANGTQGKTNIPSKKDCTPRIVLNEPTRVENKELFVKVAKIPNTENYPTIYVNGTRGKKNIPSKEDCVILNEPARVANKELFVKVSRFPNKLEKSDKTAVRVGNPEAKSNSENDPVQINYEDNITIRTNKTKGKCRQEEKNVIENIKRIGKKELFVNIKPIVDVDKYISIEDNLITQCSNSGTSKKLVETEMDHAEMTESNKVQKVKTSTKTTTVTQIPSDKETGGYQKTNLKNHNATGNPVRNVKFTLETTELPESHNLRKLEPRNYMEESMLDNDLLEKSKEPQNTDRVPIYRKIIFDEPKRNNNENDLYEFVDASPKTKKVIGRRPHRSSILFDKDTHEILQKIEEKEAKAKRKVVRKKRNAFKPDSKQYEKKIEAIILKVQGKIGSKNKENHVTSDRTDKKLQSNNENVVKNTNVPSSDSHSKVFQVNNINNEINIIVHQPVEVQINKEKLVPQEQISANKTENVTMRRGGTPLDTFDKLKESVNAIQIISSPVPWDSISICSDSHDPDPVDDFDSCLQEQDNVPLRDSHTQIIQVNNFSDETSIIVHHPGEVPVSKEILVPERQNSAISTVQNKNVGVRRGERAEIIMSNSKNAVNKENLDMENDIVLTSVREALDSDNAIIHNDINSCFGFGDDALPPVASTPNKKATKGAVNILTDVVIRHGAQNVESPVDFNVRRLNAHSTMIHVGARNRTSSPWRLGWVNARPNFVSVKSNALPRLDQEPVLDHTLVEEFEENCSRTLEKRLETPAKKAPVQQSILDFIESNIENENQLQEGSLFDYEAFNSPKKKTRKGKENQKAEAVKRNLGNQANIASSTPVQRRVLADISNSSGEQAIVNSSSEDLTYFGFDESSSGRKTPEKRKPDGRIQLDNNENDDGAKPSRFDLRVLRSYAAKDRKKKKKVAVVEEPEAVQVPDESISLVEVSNEEDAGDNLPLFEEPEEMLDNMSPVQITEKRHRRKRLDSSNSDAEEQEKKRKKHKKTKLEIEQEKWIEEFNQMCAEIDQHELELE